MNYVFRISLISLLLTMGCKAPQKSVTSKAPMDSPFLTNLLSSHPQYFGDILAGRDKYLVQIIYTQIDRRENGKPVLTDHFFQVSDSSYFYPASTVKFPIAVLALQKLKELGVSGLDRNTSMITETAFDGQTPVYADPGAIDGRPTVEQYIKKILLVSDNDASNRLYEFLGQAYINNTLHKMGYTDAQIIHRLSVNMNEEQHRNTNPVHFLDTGSKMIYEKKAERSELVYANRDTKMGVGYYAGGQLRNEPFDFSKRNRLTVKELHGILKSVIFPDAVPKQQRFNLNDDDYSFLWKYMSMFCTESRYPTYDSSYWPNYIKYALAGSSKTPLPPSIRIFNKSGQAYGFLTDVAYIVDFDKGIEFLVTATIHCNADGIYNDDKYDYNTIGFPFLQHLGQVLYDYELTRKKKYQPYLTNKRYNYAE